MTPPPGIRQPLAYLFQLVRNLAIDQHRQTALEWRYFADDGEGLQVPAPAASPEARFRSMQHRFERCIACGGGLSKPSCCIVQGSRSPRGTRMHTLAPPRQAWAGRKRGGCLLPEVLQPSVQGWRLVLD